MSTTEPSPLDPPRQKTVLFCRECGHESPVAGDWTVSDSDRRVLGCPECGATVTARSYPLTISP